MEGREWLLSHMTLYPMAVMACFNLLLNAEVASTLGLFMDLNMTFLRILKG